MPTHSTLTGPFGPPARGSDDRRWRLRARPAYSRAEEEREIYAGTSRIGRIVPVVVAAIGAVVILGTAVLYGAGVVGAPTLHDTPPLPMNDPSWTPNAAFSQALAVQALRNLDEHAPGTRTGAAREVPRNEAAPGSLLPPEREPREPGMTVTPPAADEDPNADDWEPPVEPKTPEGTEDLPKPADPETAPPSGYAE